jgi:hypothetical protein
MPSWVHCGAPASMTGPQCGIVFLVSTFRKGPLCFSGQQARIHPMLICLSERRRKKPLNAVIQVTKKVLTCDDIHS